jgi:predicted RNase H-like HicB family nuclease
MGSETMTRNFRLEYWRDGDWFVGRLPDVPGVFSQGATLDELEENVLDAYRLMRDEQAALVPVEVTSKDIQVEV